MNVDNIPGQLEELFDRARAAFDQQITKARKVVADLNAEKAVATKALAELKEQHGKAEAELETTLANLDKASSLRGLNSELMKARTEAERLTVENEKAAATLEARLKKCAEADAKLVALETGAREATAARCRAEETVQQLKIKLGV